VETLGLTTFFVGVVILPVIGNLAEQIVAVQLAWKNRMEFSMAVAYGASPRSPCSWPRSSSSWAC
jgi:Ca2+:H+ antiporter